MYGFKTAAVLKLQLLYKVCIFAEKLQQFLQFFAKLVSRDGRYSLHAKSVKTAVFCCAVFKKVQQKVPCYARFNFLLRTF